MGKIKEETIRPKVLGPGDQGYEYNLNDPNARQIIKSFETELGERTLKQYQIDKKFLLISPANGANGKAFNYESINGSKFTEYINSFQLYKALEKLRARRAYAKKQELESQNNLVSVDLPF